MKSVLSTLLGLFCIFNIYALQVSGLRSSAISDVGFTARWDAVSGASEYDLELKQGVQHKFNFDDSSQFPDGWSTSNASIYTLKSLARSVPNFAMIDSVNGYIKTNQLENPGTLSFYCRTSTVNGNGSLKIQKSSDGSTWSDITTLIANGNNTGDVINQYRRFDLDINESGSFYLRIFTQTYTIVPFIFDDLQYTELNSQLTLPGNTSHLAWRANGLVPETNYLVRVKPIGISVEQSDWLQVATLATDPSTSGSTAIMDEPATMDVSPSAGIYSHSISILPASPGIHDFMVQAQTMESTYVYAVSCVESSALNASYSIFHPGLEVTGCTVSDGTIQNYDNKGDVTSFDLAGFSAKGELIIYLETGETLPVNMSTFDVSLVSNNKCRLTWQTQSESQMLGYYVLRSSFPDLLMANIISALIPAQNSSQPVEYVFLDNNASLPAHYWLQAVSYDGGEQIFGPVYQSKPDSAEVPHLPESNSLRIFPNPFGKTSMLHLRLDKSQALDYKVYNSRGQLVQSGSLGMCPEGDYQLSMPIDYRLSSGLYFLVLEGEFIQFKEQFVIQN